jgi:signal transduction histidine kinase
VVAPLGGGPSTRVYRAIRHRREYALRILDPGEPGARASAGQLARASHPALARIVAVGEWGGTSYLVQELVHGQALEQVLADGPLPPGDLLELGCALAGALAEVHQLGLIHGAVRPGNVVLRPGGAPALLGFGPARADPRADLYALGALLFQCSAGPGGDGRSAPAAGEPSISPALSGIIARLLAPDPDDRYQSAEALLADLDLAALLEAGPEQAAPERPRTLPVIGRERELDQLRQAWSEAVHDRGRMLAIRGPAGSGKSRLAQAFLEEVQGSGGLVVAARCGAANARPFDALRAGLEGWLAALTRLPAAQRALAQQRLRIAAGDFGPVLKRFSPAFEAVLPDAPAAESDRLQERVYDILTEFLLKLAGCHGGLALFLDDVQWLDQSSREVLRRIDAAIERAPVLLLLAERGDIVSVSAQPRGAGASAGGAELTLGPLREGGCAELAARLLGTGSLSPDVVSHIASWTAGNPLGIVEYVDALVEAEVLCPGWDGWALDASRLEGLHLPGDVARLIGSRAAALGRDAVQVLQLACLLGGPVRLEQLQRLAGPGVDAAAALAEGVSAHLLRQAGPGEFEFIHAGVRDRLMSLLSQDELADLHQRIGEALGQEDDGADPRAVYAVARHLAAGRPEREPGRAYEANLAAGFAALATLADAEAYEFLSDAARIARPAGIAGDGTLEEALGAVCARSGRWEEARRHLGAALDRVPDRFRRAVVHAQLARVHLANREIQQGWREVGLGFRELGTPIGSGPLAWFLYGAWCSVVGLLSLVTRIGYGSAARAKRGARLRLLAQLSITGAYVAYLLNDPPRLLSMIVRELYAGHLLGDSAERAGALTSYSVLLATLDRPTAAERHSARSLAIAAALGDRVVLARMRLLDAIQRHVGGQPRQAEADMRRCLQQDGSWLDAADSAYGHVDLAWNLTMRGYCKPALEFVQAALARAQPGSGESLNLGIREAVLLYIVGQREQAQTRAAGCAQASEGLQPDWLRLSYFSNLALLLIEQGELGQPLADALRQARACLPRGPRRSTFHGRHTFVFSGYGWLERCLRDPSPGNIRELRRALRELRPLRGHPTLGSHYAVLRAALERLRGRPGQALRALFAAQALALEADNPWAQFEVHRQIAHTLADQGDRPGVERHVRLACELAAEQGWVSRLQRVLTEFDVRPRSTSVPLDVAAVAEEERSPERLEQHLEALLQVSLAASSTLEPGRQAQVALDELLRVLQAERAFLFTVSPYGELQLRSGRGLDGADLDALDEHGRGVVERVRASQEPLLANDAPSGGEQPRSILAAPLLMKGELLGVAYADTSLARGRFGDDDLRILLAIANHIAIALQNASAVVQQTALSRANSDLLETLRLQVADLQASRRQITAAEERLRREIAEMLHSRVQSKLLVAAHQLGQAVGVMDDDPIEAKRLLQLSQEQLDDIREREIREASHLLHPSIIKIGLAPAIRSLIGRFEDMFKVNLEVDPRLAKLDSIVDNHLPDDLRLTAYRAVEEALGNIAKHARASQVDVSLSVTAEQQLLVAIADDGVGFDSGQLRPGLGLSSIDGRVAQLGGAWRLTSELGQGTRLEVSFPLGPDLA